MNEIEQQIAAQNAEAASSQPDNYVPEGIYFNMPEEEYHAAHGLSNSGIKDIMVSPLYYWHNNINPDREVQEDTYYQQYGSSLHCKVLEPARFQDEYIRLPEKSDFDEESLLVTMDDLKAYCEANGLNKVASKKQTLIDRVTEYCAQMDAIEMEYDKPVIWDEVKRIADEKVESGLIGLKGADYDSVVSACHAVRSDDTLHALLSDGAPEVSIFVKIDGVMMKCRIDWMRINSNIDLKSFSNSRGKTIRRSIMDALFYERYFAQGVVYHEIREEARKRNLPYFGCPLGWAKGELDAFMEKFYLADDHRFGLVFVESSKPHHTAAYALKKWDTMAGTSMQANVYWTTAERQMNDAILEYRRCIEEFGDKPWRLPCEIKDLTDHDMPQIIYS